MNEEEGFVIIGFEDLFLVVDKVLDWIDLVICIVGEKGLFMVGYVDDLFKCEIEYLLLLGVIVDFNCYEFLCVMCKDDC